MQSVVLVSALVISFIAAIQGAATPPQLKEKVAALGKKCAAENKIAAGQAALAFNQAIPKDDAERCFLECVYKGVGVVENDKFSMEGSKKLVAARFTVPAEAEKATKLLEACHKEVAAKAGEKCSLGRAVRECFVHHGKSVNFFPSAA